MNARVFLATTGHGLARAARANGGGWQVEHLLSEYDVRCLAADPRNPNVIYAGTQGQGVLRSIDAGRAWLPAGLAGQVVKALAVSPCEPGVVYAGLKSPARMCVSRDAGAHWSELLGFRRIRSRWFWLSPAEAPFTAYVHGIALSPADPNVIVAGIEAGAVVRSGDGGQTWSDHRPGAVRDCHSLAFHAADGAWAYEGGGGGAAVSRDGGRTWTQPRAGLDRRYVWACAADPARPEVWYVSASPMPSWRRPGPPPAHVEGHAEAFIFRTVGGAPWEKLGGGLPQPLNYMAYALLTDLAAPGQLYAGLSNGQVWHSANHGNTWQPLPFDLPRIRSTLIFV